MPSCTGIASCSVRSSACMGSASRVEGHKIALPNCGSTCERRVGTWRNAIPWRNVGGNLGAIWGRHLSLCWSEAKAERHLETALDQREARLSACSRLVEVHKECQHARALRRPQRRVLVVMLPIELAGLVAHDLQVFSVVVRDAD